MSGVVGPVVTVGGVPRKGPPIRLTAGPRSVPVRADPGRLEQVFLNLLVNAMEHAPGSGPIEVSIRTVARRAVVPVRDRGQGVEPEDTRSMLVTYPRLGQPHR